MNRYLMSVAALALMAAPAFAQHEEHGGGHPGGGGAPHGGGGPAMHGGGPGGGHPMGAPGGAMHGGFGQRPAAPAAAPVAPAAPAAAPQAMRAQHGGFDRGNRPNVNIQNNTRVDVHNDNRPLIGNANVNRANADRNNDNRGGRNDNRGGRDDRNGFHGGQFGSNHGGQGGARNFSGFRDYHRNFSAPHRFHAPAYNRPSGWSYRRWTFGEILPSLFWGQQYWLNDFGDYDLPPPPPGAVWVRYGDDALLIDRYSGEIITVEYGVFY